MVASLACLQISLSRLAPSQAQGFPQKRVCWFTGLTTPGLPSLSVFNFIRLSTASDKQILLCNGANSTAGGAPLDVAEIGAVLSLFRQMGLNEKETKVVFNKNPDASSSSFDSIQGRIQSMETLGLSILQIARLITKRPNLLTAGDADSLIHFILYDLECKLKPSHVIRLLMQAEPKFSEDFISKVQLLVKLGIPQEKIANVLNKVNLNKAISHKSSEQIEMTITFLNRYGGPEILVRRPIILNYDLDTQLIPRIGFLKWLSNGDEEATGAVIRKLPASLSYSEEHMDAQVEFMRSFAGLSYEEIFRLILIFPNLISSSRERKLEPRINFLKECGFDSSDIYRFLTKSPLFLGLSFEGNLAYKLSMLVKIGYAYRTKDLAIALGAVTRTSVENLQKVIGLYLSYGLSNEDIVAMSKKQPQILQYNPKSLEEKMEYLVEEMGRDVGELLSFPAYLGYNLDKRIKHRYEEKKKNAGEGMSINKLLTVSVERFSRTKKKYVQEIVQSDEEILGVE
ncbi:hypothetical protein V2J09_015132 [Rumex salicifolius]